MRENIRVENKGIPAKAQQGKSLLSVSAFSFVFLISPQVPDKQRWMNNVRQNLGDPGTSQAERPPEAALPLFPAPMFHAPFHLQSPKPKEPFEEIELFQLSSSCPSYLLNSDTSSYVAVRASSSNTVASREIFPSREVREPAGWSQEKRITGAKGR